MDVRCRPIELNDRSQIAVWNRQLQEDEGSIPMDLTDVRERLDRWLDGAYEGVLFEHQHQAVGYALYRQTDPDLKGPDGMYVRQFFISRERRRTGFGRSAFNLLRDEVFPAGVRIVLEAVSTNGNAQAFWRSLGFREHSVLYELGPSHAANP